MIISRRPVSSPGRVEKYPPPLMGFLRSKSNGGIISRSKSRKSRKSPLFVRRDKFVATVTREPSSPKVTCMGQVRSNPKTQPKSRENQTRKRCKWIRNASFCNSLAGKIKTLSSWPKWGSFPFPFSRRKSEVEKVSDSPRSQLDKPELELARESFVFPATHTPPINTLLLTRSRSAPYSSSSLAFRFWEEDNQREVESRTETEHNVKSEVHTEKNFGVYKPARSQFGFLRWPELIRSKSEPVRIVDEDGVASG